VTVVPAGRYAAGMAEHGILVAPRIEPSPNLTPFIKWPGGKSHELPAIAAAAPPLTGRLIDPFVGGGAVLLATPPDVPAWANDACADLIRVYAGAAGSDVPFMSALQTLAVGWEGFAGLGSLYRELADAFRSDQAHATATTAILARHSGRLGDLLDAAGPGLVAPYLLRLQTDLPVKFMRMRRVQAQKGTILSDADLVANVEGAIRAAMYMAIRARYNQARRGGEWGPYRLADFVFLREFAYAAMFRFNATGDFNVPYGGLTYNHKSLADKVSLLFGDAMLARLRSTEWRCLDFEPFLAEASPSAEDFVFVDPPYDSEFSAYDDRPFGWRDQERLQHVLEGLAGRVMLVIKDTPMIRQLYGSDRWRIAEALKTYMWTIKSRNDREATHLTITNY